MKRSFFIALIVLICLCSVSADNSLNKAGIEMNLPSGILSLYKDGNLVQEIIVKSITKPIMVSDGIGVFLNNSLITCDAFMEEGEIYMNCKAAEDILGLTPELVSRFNIAIKELNEVIYINLRQTVNSFGGAVSQNEEIGNVYIDMEVVKVNGTFAGMNYGDYDKSDFLAVEAVKQLGYEFSEDSVDIRIFDKGIMKLKRKDEWVIDVDDLAEVLGGYKDASSRCGIVDVKLPTYLRIGDEYFKADNVGERLVLSAGAAQMIYERSGQVIEAYSAIEQGIGNNIDLMAFLEDYVYSANIFSTVIDIKLKDNQI